jgi:hypothetical protein
MNNDDHQTISYHRRQDGMYVLDAPLVYYSKRYKKAITCPTGMVSDGSTGGVDVASLSWWVHDRLCDTFRWDDGSPCPYWRGSAVLHDILWAEGRRVRSCTWWLGTLLIQAWRDMWRTSQ